MVLTDQMGVMGLMDKDSPELADQLAPEDLQALKVFQAYLEREESKARKAKQESPEDHLDQPVPRVLMEPQEPKAQRVKLDPQDPQVLQALRDLRARRDQ